jgi:hypothetical protein
MVEFRLIQCDYCSHLTLVRMDFDWRVNDVIDNLTRVTVYPPPRSLSAAVPDDLRQEWDKAVLAYDAGLWEACAVGVRRTLEATCAREGAEGRDLSQKLARLRELGKVDGAVADWADAIRVIGNHGAHVTNSLVTRQDAVDALDCSEALLDNLYALRGRLDAYEVRQQSPGDWRPLPDYPSSNF